MAQLFVSYAPEDRTAVRRLVKALRADGLEVWWDQDVSPDMPAAPIAKRQQQAARATLACWSKAAAASETVRIEAGRARIRGRLLQARLDDEPPPAPFDDPPALDLAGWTGKRADIRFAALTEAVRALVFGRSPPPGVGHAPIRPNWALLIGGSAGVIVVVVALSYVMILLTERQSTRIRSADVARERQRLIQGLNGQWDNVIGDCSKPMVFRATVENGGVGGHLTITRGGAVLREGEVTAIENGAVSVMTTAPAHELWEYRPKGDDMTVIRPTGEKALLSRCATPGLAH